MLLDTRKLISITIATVVSQVELRKRNSKKCANAAEQVLKKLLRYVAKNKFASRAPQRLRIFAGSDHAHTAQHQKKVQRWSSMADTYFYGLGRRKSLQQAFAYFWQGAITINGLSLLLWVPGRQQTLAVTDPHGVSEDGNTTLLS